MKVKRILSMLLALVMTLSMVLVGTTVSAEESLYRDVKTGAGAIPTSSTYQKRDL